MPALDQAGCSSGTVAVRQEFLLGQQLTRDQDVLGRVCKKQKQKPTRLKSKFIWNYTVFINNNNNETLQRLCL